MCAITQFSVCLIGKSKSAMSLECGKGIEVQKSFFIFFLTQLWFYWIFIFFVVCASCPIRHGFSLSAGKAKILFQDFSDSQTRSYRYNISYMRQRHEYFYCSIYWYYKYWFIQNLLKFDKRSIDVSSCIICFAVLPKKHENRK